MSRAMVAAGAAGALFGAGLALAGMTDPRRILGFLDIAGDVDTNN
ncbi:YeeE/YedE family protein, partial [Stenotrophomonas geniculata]|nr:YeeE/YedE family protein [Stenotrophomonas geniculata]